MAFSFTMHDGFSGNLKLLRLNNFVQVMEHLNSIHKVAVLCHNDCLHVAQHVLQLHFQVRVFIMSVILNDEFFILVFSFSLEDVLSSFLLCTRNRAGNVKYKLTLCFLAQYFPALPLNVQKIMAFVDLAPLFRKQGSEILQKQMHLITGDLMEVCIFMPAQLSFPSSYVRSELQSYCVA